MRPSLSRFAALLTIVAAACLLGGSSARADSGSKSADEDVLSVLSVALFDGQGGVQISVNSSQSQGNSIGYSKLVTGTSRAAAAAEIVAAMKAAGFTTEVIETNGTTINGIRLASSSRVLKSIFDVLKAVIALK